MGFLGQNKNKPALREFVICRFLTSCMSECQGDAKRTAWTVPRITISVRSWSKPKVLPGDVGWVSLPQVRDSAAADDDHVHAHLHRALEILPDGKPGKTKPPSKSLHEMGVEEEEEAEEGQGNQDEAAELG